MSLLPAFDSPFLDRLCRRLEARHKSLKHRGQMTWATEQPDEFEWLSVYFTPLVGHYCIFEFVEDNRVNVFVRSSSRANRGKIMLEIDGLNVVDSAHGIVDAIERTIRFSGDLEDDNSAASLAIRTAWLEVEVKVHRPPE